MLIKGCGFTKRVLAMAHKGSVPALGEIVEEIAYGRGLYTIANSWVPHFQHSYNCIVRLSSTLLFSAPLQFALEHGATLQSHILSYTVELYNMAVIVSCTISYLITL